MLEIRALCGFGKDMSKRARVENPSPFLDREHEFLQLDDNERSTPPSYPKLDDFFDPVTGRRGIKNQAQACSKAPSLHNKREEKISRKLMVNQISQFQALFGQPPTAPPLMTLARKPEA